MGAPRNKSLRPLENGVLKRNCKYKRVRTLMKKSVEVAIQCGLDITILVFDKKMHKIQQSYTNGSFTLRSIAEMANCELKKRSEQGRSKELKILSCDAMNRFYHESKSHRQSRDMVFTEVGGKDIYKDLQNLDKFHEEMQHFPAKQNDMSILKKRCNQRQDIFRIEK